MQQITALKLINLWTVSWRRSLSYTNQSTDLLCKSMDWFVYDRGLCHERGNYVWYIKPSQKGDFEESAKRFILIAFINLSDIVDAHIRINIKFQCKQIWNNVSDLSSLLEINWKVRKMEFFSFKFLSFK